MNNRGQIGMAFFLIFLLMAIMAFAFIEPIKESLNNNRGGDTLNCPGTSTFNQTSYDAQNTFEKLVYRPTCAATGFSLVYFEGMILIVGIVWLYRHWRGK